MYIFILLLLTGVMIYAAFSLYRRGRENSIRRHGHCCDECHVRDLCDKYKSRNNIK